MKKIAMKRVTFYRMHDRGGLHVEEPEVRDMLRYDQAFVSDADPGVVALPSWVGDRMRHPTHDRWHTFGVVLEEIPGSESHGFREQAVGRPETWRTYRHPFNADGARDYGTLEPITLGAILRATDWSEV